MKESKGLENKDQAEEQGCRGMVVVPYVHGLSEQFRRLAARKSFRTAFEPGSKIKEQKDYTGGGQKKVAPHQKWSTWIIMAISNKNVNKSNVVVFTCVAVCKPKQYL